VEGRALHFESLLRLADDRLILGHRLSQWCGHAPVLEEELALANVALDLLGQANWLYEQASKHDSGGRSPDALAFLRESHEFGNLVLVEQPNGDFAATIVRQYLFDVFNVAFLQALAKSSDPDLAAFAVRSGKEATFHKRHSHGWLLRLGDGTEESHRRTQRALDRLWRFTGEFFRSDDAQSAAVREGFLPDVTLLADAWREEVAAACAEATVDVPQMGEGIAVDGRRGRHSEHLGLLLAEMQVLARAIPGADW
jgi:ring-1,2-phenylacetyl-CoA epoxidase subunit PaaC